jgi:hypothetical protein
LLLPSVSELVEQEPKAGAAGRDVPSA